MLQQLLVWYLKSAAKVLVWFITNLGPAMMIAFIPTFAIGTIAAYASGIVAIYLVLDVVRRGNLQYFAYYCFAVGGLGLWLF